MGEEKSKKHFLFCPFVKWRVDYEVVRWWTSICNWERRLQLNHLFSFQEILGTDFIAWWCARYLMWDYIFNCFSFRKGVAFIIIFSLYKASQRYLLSSFNNYCSFHSINMIAYKVCGGFTWKWLGRVDIRCVVIESERKQLVLI